MQTVTEKRFPCLSTQRQKGPDWSLPNRRRYHRLEGSCRAGQQGSGKGQGPRCQLLWVHGSSPRASPWGRHHVRMGTCAPRTTQEGTKEPSANRRQHAACSGGSEQRQPEPRPPKVKATSGQRAVPPRGRPPTAFCLRRQRRPSPHGSAQASCTHRAARAAGGGHPADAGNRTGMRPDMFGRSAERDRHVCPSRRGQARLLTRLPGAPPCAGHWGPRWWRCWRPEPLLQPSPVPAPAPPPHGPQVGQRHRPPGVPLPRTGLGGPAAGGHRGLAGERTEGGWGSGDQPPAAGPTGRRADAPSAVSPSPCSSSCRQDPSQPDHPGDPGLRP